MKHNALRIRRANDRLHTQMGWLDSWHTFSFGHHYDPQWMSHRALRVINDDIIAGGGGFDWHGHRDMEIITWVLSGALLHRDDTGSEELLHPGEAQRMRAGSGIRHGEWNASSSDPLHLLQIWIEPNQRQLPPSHQQERIAIAENPGRWHAVAGGNQAPLDLKADAQMVAAHGPGTLPVTVESGHSWWLHLATGSAQLGDLSLQAGDGIGIDGAFTQTLELAENSQALAFQLA